MVYAGFTDEPVWVLDLSYFETVAIVIRWAVWIGFVVMLIKVTPRIAGSI